ncbi:hypothetical protein RI129_004650 [Pyrocoelia pectoralis]|uniref:Uncharacterized protein n=1 Tax=Pyrocoelia pectoralis TaxID=417401 RepID=A0AAN7VJP0_9COLE
MRATCICEKQVNNADKSVVHKPRPQGLISLLSYAEKRQDNAGKRILQQKDDLLKDGEILILAGGFENSEKVVLYSKNEPPQTLNNLYSNQEEADTRIILHLLHESRSTQQILVKFVDTDVLLLLIHFCSTIPHLETITVYMQLGRSTNRRFLCIGKIIQQLGALLCSCLMSMHCLTGCDTTSALYKIGKKSAFDVLKRNIAILENLSKLPTLPEDKALEVATQYMLLLYKNENPTVRTLNDLRLKLATTSNKPAPELPPTDAAFYQHFLRILTSSSSSSSDEEDLNPRKARIISVKESILEQFDDINFKMRFRVSKDCATEILHLIGQHQLEPRSGRNMPIPAMTQLLLTLRYYAAGSFQICTGNIFKEQLTAPTSKFNHLAAIWQKCIEIVNDGFLLTSKQYLTLH